MKIGLEIHQRLDTHKLFCNCPSELAEGKEPAVVADRRLHPVFSELGEIDRASMAEFEKSRLFEYQAFAQSNCLVELDEEPPFPLNREALKIAIEIALHLNAKVADEVHIMRKMVIDGSNTAGFQRTAIVGFNGCIETSKGSISVPLVALEEESAGIVETKNGKTIYRLDRLGIPLVEITTTPDIQNPEHLKEVAEKIGLIMRATGKVARGIGTIRQDINVSIEGGARVEIKGAQELKLLPVFVENEVRRQEKLIVIIRELEKRKAYGITAKPVDFSGVFAATASPLLKKEMESGGVVLGIKLPGHSGMLGMEIQPGKRYGTELSDYAKQAGVKGIIHSDEDISKYKFSEKEISAVRAGLGVGGNDAFVLVAAPKAVAGAALAKVIERADMNRVPEETRRANPDGTTTYMRPLPGRARMYPETDVPPVPVNKELMAETEKGMAGSYEDKKASLMKMLNREMAETMLRSRHLKLFEKLVADGIDPVLAATTLENTLVSLRREGVELKDADASLTGLFSEYKKGRFAKAAIPDIIRGIAGGREITDVIAGGKLGKMTGKELERIVRENGFDMKRIMAAYRTRIETEELLETIKKLKKGGK
ncbi:Glu-tRNA(Gln) amidotransferase subunit GatE [Candidatus Micrarchaeota archaeon]|nr:Glu-tRNA(Gln) amidotransferase subunit GatE [Candidatus Micrarchaeota archaeon]